ncbi:glucokinase [Rhizocola hellebori]|uniref:Glucokinase n=1 Tax=Rhizocola hellebori TaxID=1392758 RepID=A0A8J3QFQ2_9ACTN|nr:ROK family glucokinase [Rhizocola hellebori]GIH08825.1 glucokinase [Rhizocola hellebori]
MSLTIGVDIGGTKVLGGVVDPQGNVLQTSRRPTPANDVAATRDVIVEVVRELIAQHPVEAVGIGAAGWIDASRSTVLFAPNLAWRNEPLRDYVGAAVDVPVVVENDANVAAWAEFKYGAAAHADDSMVMFTVGTGIGGGIVLGGQLLRGSHGMAAEVGHMLAVPEGHLCGCGRLGCIEQYASGNALVRFAKEGAMTAPSALLKAANGDIEAIDGPMVTTAAMEGDSVAVEAFGQVGYWLAQGVADMVQLLDPQVIVIGGGVIDAGDLLMKPLRQAYADALTQRGKLPVAELRSAEMGNEAGLIGAADLARSR